jgi:UDP-N-acetylmuramoyl-tripeptide--D-alanyl-D-alanine ligase
MKKLAKKLVAAVLGYQVKKLRQKNNFKIVGVVGSIGKTSTKLAIANVLKAGVRVQYQEGNYNDLVSVPLIFFGQELPSLFNPLAWIMVFWRNQKILKQPYPFDVVVVELGSDAPGQIREFKSYLNLEIGVLTSISPEHMAFFSTLDEVAKEELAIGEFSSLTLANSDLSDEKYYKNLPNFLTYSIHGKGNLNLKAQAGKITVFAGQQQLLEALYENQSSVSLYNALAATAVAYKLGMTPDQIAKGLANIKPVPGRMQRLRGVEGSLIIDDSYNSSPDAAKLALDYLYSINAPQKIAVLGNMNELGGYSKQAHEEIGNHCDPKQLELVITIGPDANNFLAKAAEAKGCRVERFDSPYKAGDFIRPLVKQGAAILVKGSQNKVFAEEAIKPLLADQTDSEKLVRQTPQWLNVKREAFKP